MTAAEKMRLARVEGVAHGGDEHIYDRGVHDVLLHRAENEPQQGFSYKDEQYAQRQGEDNGGEHDLMGGLARVFRVVTPDVLGAYDGAAGGEGGEEIDNEKVHCVHQRYAGDRGLADIRDHQRVRDAHQPREHLLDDQRDEQRPQAFFVKFHECATSRPSAIFPIIKRRGRNCKKKPFML